VNHVLTLEPVPRWLDAARLLGASGAACDWLTSEPIGEQHVRLTLTLPAAAAADVAAQLRGLGFDGQALGVSCAPPLSRAQVREARLREARARRETSPGFTRPGARATGEGRYSLTPEALALELGELAARAGLTTVVDACCGSGGNTIGFARAGCRVTALECDEGRLAEARHNTSLYGVRERVDFHLGDARKVVTQQRADLLFVDPPWGEQFDKRSTSREDFPLLSELLALDLAGYRELWLKLPSSFRVASIEGAEASAWFGRAPGDARRVKFVLLRVPPQSIVS